MTSHTPPNPVDTPLPAAPAVAFYNARAYEPNDSVGYLMRRILTLVGQGVERELEPTGLTNAQWIPLFKLHRGCATTVAELARECGHDTGATTRLVDRLEAKGLCQRVRSQEDRRVVHIELTPTGQAAAQEIPVILSKVQNDYLAGFTLEEWQTLKSYLRRILDTAQTLQSANASHEHEQ
ncbi:MarR family transcriptional regulator [Rhodoferax sp.]|uniref:MarR family winged helix-turn-helix transcriptional regulator n=1 Tax=Rhodoferax sp. TaxID=50421 RepID=UPI00284FFF45|nr:MarR family transcriptional regulator [Rhodoferax sp.]MDR3368434.1 MarR family transcriptional regulator [Rhodoferax sp.]